MSETTLRPASEGFPHQFRLKGAGEPGISCPECGEPMQYVHAKGHGIVAACGGKTPFAASGSHPWVLVTHRGVILK